VGAHIGVGGVGRLEAGHSPGAHRRGRPPLRPGPVSLRIQFAVQPAQLGDAMEAPRSTRSAWYSASPIAHSHTDPDDNRIDK
jgi:hypothetical protein